MTESAVGFPALSAVTAEVRSVAETVSRSDKKANVSVFLNRDFTQQNFKTALGNPRQFVHIATHYTLTGDGVGGGQLLVGDGSLMAAKDIWESLPNLRNVNLVTLSACDTGANLRNGGSEHIDGLSNVFLSHGAEFVIGTLWAVADDATADFMRIFYDFYLSEKQTAPEALRATKRAFVTAGEPSNLPSDLRGNADLAKRLRGFRDASYWAAFQIFSPNRTQATSKTVH